MLSLDRQKSSMKKSAFSLIIVSLFLVTACRPTDSSSSETSSIPVFDDFYQAPNPELTYYDISRAGEMDSIPSLGTTNLLVIPVVIEGYEQNATTEIHDDIETMMFGEASDTSWQSVASFYHQSSYGRLTLSGDVTEWFPSGYSVADMERLESRNQDAVATLLEDAVDWVKTSQPQLDLTDYDNDQDGHLDAVWLVYSAPSQISDIFWAFVSWNYHNQYNKNFANPTPFTYGWASFDFIYEGYGKDGIDAHTFIHETGHLLGLDDYYDYDYKTSPMGMIDMMDNNIIDHNGYSKFALGWTNPYVVTGDADIEILPASTSGQSILLSADWNGHPFDEYLLIELYTPDGLNEKDTLTAYPGNGRRGFTVPGIRMYHVDSRLFNQNSSQYVDSLGGGAYVGASNSSSWAGIKEHKSTFKLLSVVDAAKNIRYMASAMAMATDKTLFKTGDTFSLEGYKSAFPLGSSLTMNDGSIFPFTIEFVDVNSQFAQVKIRTI